MSRRAVLRSSRVNMLRVPQWAAALPAGLTLLVLWVGPAPASPQARTSTVTKVNEHIALKLVKRSGSTGFEHAGRATGTVAGAVHSKITLAHAVVLQGTVTITTSRGRLRLDVDGRARSIELRSKFEGMARIAGGSGRYAHAHGTASFKGVVNRSTWAATIDAAGSFSY
jgi:hypothetical protein